MGCERDKSADFHVVCHPFLLPLASHAFLRQCLSGMLKAGTQSRSCLCGGAGELNAGLVCAGELLCY